MRILIVRLDGVGDAAVCVPLIAALRAAGHQVGMVLSTRNAGLFAPHVLIAEHVVERIPWPAHGSTPESTARAKREIAAAAYDVALIASEEPEAFELAAPVRERVGFTTGGERPLKTLWVRRRTTRTVNRSQRLGVEPAHEVEVIYRLGAGLVEGDHPPVDRSLFRDLLLEEPNLFPYDDRRRAIVLQAGPKWTAAGVSPAVQRAICERLEPYARVVAGPGEREAVRELTGVTPQTFASTREWVEMLGHESTVVTTDTGAAHVAGMLVDAVIDVFADRHFEAQVRRWRPWASSYRAFRASEVDGGPRSRFIEAVLDGF